MSAELITFMPRELRFEDAAWAQKLDDLGKMIEDMSQKDRRRLGAIRIQLVDRDKLR